MEEQFSSESGHEILEEDMKRLAQEVSRHREQPEHQNLSDKELLKKSIQKLVPVTSQTAVPVEPPPSPLPDYAQSVSAEVKLEIEYLLDVAFHKGIAKANGIARQSNPFILDTFHDALVGKLYPELKKRGLLK